MHLHHPKNQLLLNIYCSKRLNEIKSWKDLNSGISGTEICIRIYLFELLLFTTFSHLRWKIIAMALNRLYSS